MSAITNTVENAIYNWVRVGSQLTASHVVWSDERGPQPQGCYIAMRLGDERRFGGDWIRKTDVVDPDPGQELEYTATGVRIVTLTLECFAAGDAWATARPDKKLARVISARALPSIADALRAARVGVGPIGPVQALRLERAKIFEPRAMITIDLHLVSELSERGTFIERVELETEIDEQAGPLITIERP